MNLYKFKEQIGKSEYLATSLFPKAKFSSGESRQRKKHDSSSATKQGTNPRIKVA
jgi:hypothetical protein